MTGEPLFREIFGTLHDLDAAGFVHGGDISGAEPAVGGPAMRLVRRIVVAGGDPRATDFDLPGGRAIPGRFSLRTHQANFHKGRGPTLFSAGFVFFVVGPVAHVRPESAGRAYRRGLGHAPEVLDL